MSAPMVPVDWLRTTPGQASRIACMMAVATSGSHDGRWPLPGPCWRKCTCRIEAPASNAALASRAISSGVTGTGCCLGSVSTPVSAQVMMALSVMIASPPELPGRQVLHDLLGTAADGVDLHLAVDALHPAATHEAGAAEDLDCLRRTQRQRLGGLVLEHAQLGHYGVAAISAPGDQLDHRLSRLDALEHVDQLVADHLPIDERLPEGLAQLGIGERL